MAMDRRHFLTGTAISGVILIVPTIASQFAQATEEVIPPSNFSADFGTAGHLAEGAFDFTRSSVKTDLLPSSPPGARFHMFKPDIPVITPTKGVLIEESREQFLAQPDRPESQSVTLTLPEIYTLWVNGGGRAQLVVGSAVVVGAGTASHGKPLIFRVVSGGTVNILVEGRLSAFQLEKGHAGTSFIPMKGERAADSLIPIGPLAALLNAESGVIVVEAISTPATDPYASLVRIGANALGMDMNDGGAFGADDDSKHPMSAALGTARFRDGARALLAWTPVSRKLVAAGGIIRDSKAPLKVNHSTVLEIGAKGKAYWNGYIRRIDAFLAVPSEAELRAFTADVKSQIVVMGDSLTARNEGGPEGLSFPARLGALLGKEVLNGGVGGDNSSQIARRYANSPQLWNLPLVVWAGRNNFMSAETVLTDIANLISRNNSGKVLILSVINGQLPGEQKGGKGYLQLTALNRALAERYGPQFLDVQSALVQAYDPDNPVDRLDYAEDRVPYSLRATNELDQRYYFPSGLDPIQTAFECSTLVRPNYVIKAGQEYILVTASTGAEITQSIRGYGSRGSASAHAVNTLYARTDPVHLNDRGRAVVANRVAEQIRRLDW
jgi:lysophospholipase L1-like esterase